MTIKEALAIYDDPVLWGSGSWDDAVCVLVEAVRDNRAITDELVEAADRALSEINPGSLIDVWLSRQGQPVSALVNALKDRLNRPSD